MRSSRTSTSPGPELDRSLLERAVKRIDTIGLARTARRVLPRQGDRKGRDRPITPDRRWINPTRS